MPENIVLRGKVNLGAGTVVEDNVVLGHREDGVVDIGENSLIRSGTVIYSGVRVGRNVEIGANVTIESDVVLGKNISLVNNTIIRKGAIIGDNVIIGYMDIKRGRDGLEGSETTEIGENARIRSGSVIYWGTKIGGNSMVGHNTIIREKTIIGHDSYIGSLVMFEGDSEVGNYVGINAQSHITKFSKVGDYTFIGPICVTTNDNKITHRRAGHGRNLVGFTTGMYVRMGAGITVLPGVYFGEGCIVAAGSVVTKDVPPYKVVMGVPAKVVKDAPRDEIMEQG